MSSSMGKQAVVIGAGTAALTAAKALSAHSDQVIMLENCPSGPSRAPGRAAVATRRRPHSVSRGGPGGSQIDGRGEQPDQATKRVARARTGESRGLWRRPREPRAPNGKTDLRVARRRRAG